MIYEIHLYVPKTGKLTPAMLEWLFENGQSDGHPEAYWPVYRIKPHAVARRMLRLDNQLIPKRGPGQDVELHFPNAELGIVLYIHDRGVILFFPYMAYSVYSRVVLGICFTYMRYLYDIGGFWNFDPQLNILAAGGDFDAMERTAVLMDRVMPRLLTS
jgi:hypothetical protein